ncbi:MAG TPA: hypothetical protein VJG32_03305 [Anaerolineae bacterium]|nr:hypothetical protein [Anaerolineae bacterium]
MTAYVRRDALLLFAILLVCYTYFLPRWADWNQNSRFYLVRAVVEKGTLAIDAYAENTGDYATINGHTYSDKAPGLSFAAAPIYAVVNAATRIPAIERIIQRLANSPAFADTLNSEGTGLLEDKIHAALGLAASTFVLVMLPSAALGVMLYAFLAQIGLPRLVCTITPLIYGLATIAFPYSGAFYGHQFVAVLLFAAFYLAFLMRRRRIGARAMPVIGFLLSYAVISEFPAGLIAVAIALYAVYATPDRRWILGAIVVGLPPLVLLGAHNAAIFGAPFKLGYEYSTLWSAEHSTGFLSLTYPTFQAVWGITLDSYRGLYFIAPILLLAWPGLIDFWKARAWRAEWVVCGWAIASFFVFNASSVMWQGGYSIGPRYLVPMLPFAAVPLAFGLAMALRRRWSMIVVGMMGLWSLAAVWALTIGGQSYPDYTLNPLFNYALPKLANGDIARNLGMLLGLRGWASLLPLIVICAVFIGLLVRRLGSLRLAEYGLSSRVSAGASASSPH